MASKKGNYPIPFNSAGDQMHYPEPLWAGGKRVDPVMKDNFVFEDTLTFLTYSRGRSAAYFEFTRRDGKKVCFFMKDFSDMVPHMVNGLVTGKFTFTKRGQNYGTIFIGT